MTKGNIKKEKRVRRHAKIRTRVAGTKDVPRLSIFKSNKFVYAQIIDDSTAKTLAAAKGEKTLAGATKVGKAIAEKAAAQKIKAVVFDRGGFAYKGRVKAIADGAREGGLKF